MTREVLIVEDEPVAADRLEDYLAAEPSFACVGVAATGPDAVEAIDRLRPDVVLLDVELPGFSGVEVLLRTDHEPAVVFTTAYDQHAVTAFELGAFDYLVKPFGEERFREALGRLEGRLDAEPEAGSVPSASERAETALSEQDPLRRLFVRSAGKIVPVRMADVLRLEARGDYVRLHLADDAHLVSLTMTEFQERLDPARFLRVHRSHIVNLDHVEEVSEHDDRRLELRMRDGASVVASRSGSKKLRDLAV